MNRKASPIPWVVGVRYDRYGWPNYLLRDMRNQNDNEEIQANVDLIRAAPMMYRKLKSVIAEQEYGSPDRIISEELGDEIKELLEAIENQGPIYEEDPL